MSISIRDMFYNRYGLRVVPVSRSNDTVCFPRRSDHEESRAEVERSNGNAMSPHASSGPSRGFKSRLSSNSQATPTLTFLQRLPGNIRTPTALPNVGPEQSGSASGGIDVYG